MSVYILAAIVRKHLEIEASLYTSMQVFSVAVFEKMSMKTSAIPSFHTTANSALNEPHCATLSAKRALNGTSLPSGMVGIRS